MRASTDSNISLIIFLHTLISDTSQPRGDDLTFAVTTSIHSYNTSDTSRVTPRRFVEISPIPECDEIITLLAATLETTIVFKHRLFEEEPAERDRLQQIWAGNVPARSD